MIINKDLIVEDKNYSLGDICDVVDTTKAYTLYSSTGSTSATLTDDISNYRYLEIAYKENVSNKTFWSSKVPTSQDGVILYYFEVPTSATGNIRFFGTHFRLNGNTIERGNGYGFCTLNGSDSVHYESRILIVKVVGYK